MLRVFVPSIIGGSPSVQGETCATLCVYPEDYTCSVCLCPTRTNRGHTGGGKHRGFFFFYVSFLPDRPPAVLAFILIARRVRPPLSLVNTKVEFCLLTKLFSYKSLSTTMYESEKKPTLAEIRTRDLVARRLREYRLDHRRRDRHDGTIETLEQEQLQALFLIIHELYIPLSLRMEYCTIQLSPVSLWSSCFCFVFSFIKYQRWNSAETGSFG